jgi:lysophospholipase L1-like esterase
MRIQAGSRLVMTGDSITDAGRARPFGERAFGGLGTGYVNLVDALLGACHPKHDVRLINSGVSGNTVRDLAARWKTDVLDLKPDWVSVMIGINDVWRQYDSPLAGERHVLPEEYEATLDGLAASTLPALRGMILMAPYYIEPNKADAMRATMDRYGAIVRRVAEKRGALFVDTQAAVDEALSAYYPATLSWDRVHPQTMGHMVLARAFLRAVGFRWE